MDRVLDPHIIRTRLLRRWGIRGITLLPVLVILTLAPGWFRPSVHRNEIRTGRVERGDIEATVRASGTVIPAVERVVASPLEGRVVRVLLQPGAVVKTGDPILELDTSSALLELEKTTENLAQNTNDQAQRRLRLNNSVAALERLRETQQLDLEMAQNRLSQIRTLFKEGLASGDMLSEAEVAVRKATIQLQQSAEEIQAEKGTFEADMERLRLNQRVLARERNQKQHELDLAATRAERPGVLTWVINDAGAVVRKGEVLARVADLASFRVEATVSDAYAEKLKPGQPVHVLVGEQTLEGALATILPTIENGALKFTVDLKNPSHAGLCHNLRVDVLVITGFRPQVLRIPRGPFLTGGGDRFQVFVIRGGKAFRTDIRLGLMGHQFVELAEGAGEGEEIILSDLRDVLYAKQIRVKP